jgi:hypothetical protein
MLSSVERNGCVWLNHGDAVDLDVEWPGPFRHANKNSRRRIVAIALNEPDAAGLEAHIADDPVRLISAATVLEATIDPAKQHPDSVRNSARLLLLWTECQIHAQAK